MKHVLMVFLMMVIAATPLLIRQGLAINGHLIIQEEFLETALIMVIIGLSYLILNACQRFLDAYRRAVNRAGEEKSKLVSRLVDAFNYFGSVKVGIKEIQSVVCECDHYPQTRKEFNQFTFAGHLARLFLDQPARMAGRTAGLNRYRAHGGHGILLR